MRFPWQNDESRFGEVVLEPEVRESSYTDQVVAALVGAATGNTTATAAGTAALEACAALYAMSFAMARVSGTDMAVRVLDASTLALMARNCIRRGESIHAIMVERDGLELIPAGSWDVRGRWRESTWYYRVDLFGPTGNVTRVLPGANVIHHRYSVDPARPWLGLGPLSWARSTSVLAGRLEGGLADEASAPSALLLPVPQDGGDDDDEDNDPLAKLKSDIGNAKGKPLLVETTAAGWGEGQAGAPRRDWKQERVGPDWPDVMRTTRTDVFYSVADACAVPTPLLDARAEGTSQREALRRFLHLGVEPLAEIMATELSRKMNTSIEFDFTRLRAGDLAGTSRAVGVLVKAGMTIEDALAKVGL